jgi:hypothetical protein
MPRETVWIDLACSFPYKAGGQFFATLAYPKRAKGALRDRFLWALCRWRVLKRAAHLLQISVQEEEIIAFCLE